MIKLKRKSIVFMCVLTLLASVIATPNVACAAETQSSLNKKIENAQNQIDENNKKKSELSDQIDDLETKIADAEAELNSLSDEIAETQKKISDKKAELEQSDKDLSSRLRNIYKGGSLGFLDVIFSSDNASDLFSNLEMVKYIFKNDKEVVAKLKAEYEEICVLEEELKTKQEELEAKQEELNSDKTLLTEQSDALTADNESLEEDIDQWKADSAALEEEIKSIVSSGSGYQGTSTSSSGYKWPVPGYTTISSSFAYRICPYHGSELHSGIDIPAAYGTSVIASKPGKVIYAGWKGSYGNCVIIDHGGGVTTLYGHNSSLTVSVGQYVNQGDVIAKVGSTGNSTGNHCHFEVRINGSPTNPMNYL